MACVHQGVARYLLDARSKATRRTAVAAQLTFNQEVLGSSPSALTTKLNDLGAWLP